MTKKQVSEKESQDPEKAPVSPEDEAEKSITPDEEGAGDEAQPEEPTAWERYRLASHNERPRSKQFINALFTDFMELHGDRNFRDDKAVICGFGRFEGRPVTVIGQEMGNEARERQLRNFGMMHPEGYRKAMRVMNLGSRFGMPILILIDTKGAYPGIGAEERGQAEAIARNIRDMYNLEVPVIVTVIGAGASGGALGIGLGDRVLMLENSWYNVISPEGCAAILWNDQSMAERAAEALKLTADEVYKLGVIDEIVPEPGGGAHMAPEKTFKSLTASLRKHLKQLDKLSLSNLQKKRFEKYRCMGVFRELPPEYSQSTDRMEEISPAPPDTGSKKAKAKASSKKKESPKTGKKNKTSQKEGEAESSG